MNDGNLFFEQTKMTY